MAAGTLSVTNNSKAVVGVGTTFTAFKAGDFLTLVVGQVPYTVAIASVESDTALTLVLPFDGPTATGLAWDGVARDTMSLATMGVTVQAQKALRLMIADENNWRAIFGEEEEITITLPNGQVMQGMSWGYLSSLMKEVDPVEMRNLQQQAAASEAAAQGFRNEAEGFKTETAGIRDATNQIKADTQAIHDATNTIKTQTDQIKADTQAIKDQTNQIKTDTGVIRDEANTAKTDAQAARDAARGFRDQAEEWAQSVAPDNLLTKSGNLAGLADRAAAWLNVRPIGSTPLAGDPVGDYDAVTKRWVENKINTGTVGPTMNGVMNYGVGDFHLRDSRAYIQPYEVVSDGQLLNRADWPELWAYAQMVGVIEDSVWLADKFQRGKYSSGNGTTTFRVPDKNGVQEGSIRALYGRGDGGNSGANGHLFESAAPNITGAVPSYSGGSYAQVFGSIANGAFFANNGFFPNGGGDAIPSTGNIAVEGRYNTLNFDASRSSPIYGASNDEILTRNFVGVWVIRASGGFVAANTSWSVKNADDSAPPLNATVRGGEVVSEYSNPAGKRFARLYSDTTWGSYTAAVIESEGSAKHSYKFYDDGTVDFRQSGKVNPFRMYTPSGTWTGITDADGVNLTTNGMDRVAIESGSDTLVRGYSIGGTRPNGYPTKVGYHMYIPGNNAFGIACLVIGGDNGKFCRYFFDIDGRIYGSTDYGNFSYTKNGTSDSRVKHGIAPVGVDKSYSNIRGLEFVKFVYNNDEQERVRHGVIAQQAETVEPLYVKTRKYVGINPGEIVEQKELDTTPMLLDTMHVVQTLMQKIEAMEAEIAALKK